MDEDTLRWINGLSKIYEIEEAMISRKFTELKCNRLGLLHFLESCRSENLCQNKKVGCNPGKDTAFLDTGSIYPNNLHLESTSFLNKDETLVGNCVNGSDSDSLSEITGRSAKTECLLLDKNENTKSEYNHCKKEITKTPHKKIMLFLNGFVIENAFYSNSNSNNFMLYKMLSSGIINKEALEVICGSLEQDTELTVQKFDVYFDESPIPIQKHSHEEAEAIEQMKRMKIEMKEETRYIFVIGKGKISRLDHNSEKTSIKLPKEMYVGHETCYKFTLVYKSQSSTVYVSSNSKIRDVIDHLQTTLNATLGLMLSGEILDDQESASKLSKTMVDVIIN